MRFFVEVSLEKSRINKDKNRIFMSLLKHCLSTHDRDYFEQLYGKGRTKQKNFTFSVIMPECKFLRDEIEIPNQKILMNVSSYDMQLTIKLLNSFIENIGKKYNYKGNRYKIEKVKLMKEKNIDSENVIFKTMSPCIAREHESDNKKTWYYSLNEERGREVFLKNLKIQALSEFPNNQKDIDNLQIEVLENKDVKVKYYDIVVLSNLSKFKMIGKSYLLDYFYKSGAASLKSAGFGMLDIIC